MHRSVVHSRPSLQSSPEMHGKHSPVPSHTPPCAQPVWGATGAWLQSPLLLHTSLVHSSPSSQSAADAHLGWHRPVPSQTPPCAQPVPAATPPCEHSPPLHTSVVHSSPSLHSCAEAHFTQAPAPSHTFPPEHAV